MSARIASISLALLWTLSSSPATAAALQPTGNWDVDYGEAQCTATRAFGTPTNPILLGIIPSLNGETYRLVINAQHSGPKYAQETQGTVDFGQGKIRTWLLHYGAKGVKASNYQVRIPAAEMAQARSSSAVALRSDPNVHYDFALSEMPALLDALSKCTADLQQYWNLGEKFANAPATPSKGDVRSLFSADDYPTEALMNGLGGTAQFQLLIDEKGTVAGCDVLRDSGVPVLDVMSCQVLEQRAKFNPAIDSHGKAVRSVMTTPPIKWMVSKPSPTERPDINGRAFVNEKGRRFRAALPISHYRESYQPKVKPARAPTLPFLLKPVAMPALTATLGLTSAPICSAPAKAPR